METFRTHKCDELRLEDVGKKVKISGFLETIRDLGGLVFLDIRDMYGVTQAVTSGKTEEVDFASHIPVESVLTIEGTVRKRDEETINPKLKTGLVEVFIEKIEILGKRTSELPFSVGEADTIREDLRLKYRFLDLRGKKLKENLILRAKVIQFLREKMIERDFLEVQTPILTSSSPEGARDYLVPSRVHPGKFYALPQAPQQFKQLLMVSGIDRYFQIAPCFRDEDARADRSPGEFYQLDLEMSFATQEDVFSVVEPVMYETFTKFSDKKVSSYPFKRIQYKEAMLKYGTDKPDLRNPLEIIDVSDLFEKLELNAFKGKIVRIIAIHNVKDEPRSFFEGMTDYAIKDLKAKGLAWLRIMEDRSFQGPIAKFIDEESKEEMLKRTSSKEGDAIFFIAEKSGRVEELAGAIREELGKRLGLIDENLFEFCWIVDFPMYELDERKKIAFSHNPFSMPQGGLEAVRNHDPETMIKAFEIAGYTKQDVEVKFKALFNAFHYGAPPHAGIAPGVDRIVMILANTQTIRDVIAFPMTSKAEDLLMGAPGNATEEQLREIHIKLDISKK